MQTARITRKHRSPPLLGLVAAALTALPWAAGGLGSEARQQEPMRIESTAFKEGGAIPARFTGFGADVSPPLHWSGAPAGTRSFALICDDPDAPVGTWVHWVVYGLPASARELREGVGAYASLPGGAGQGINDFRRIGYGGPLPPPGKPHRYFFKLYALDAVLALGPGATKPELLRAMQGHILAEAQTMGTFLRPR